MALAPSPNWGEPYVDMVRRFKILRKSKFVGGTKESLPLEWEKAEV